MHVRPGKGAIGVLAVCVTGGLVVACGGSPAEPSQTYTLSGNVRSRFIEEAIPDVKVEVTEMAGHGIGRPAQTVTVTSNANGHYTVTGLRGNVTVRATKTGFYPTATSVLLDQDRTWDLEMDLMPPLLPEGSDLVLGETIQSSIGPNDPRCDPQWDRNSPCRRFGFVPTSSRPYLFTVRPVGPCAELELHVFENGGARIARTSSVGSFGVDVGLVAGRTYEVRLMAYYSCELFELAVK